MKTSLLSLLIILFGSFSISQTINHDFKIVVIYFGEPIIDFNENEYKNIDFYYTPKLKAFTDSTSGKIIFSGKPKILEEWWAKQDLQYHTILYDINGIGAWEGTLSNNILKSEGFNNLVFEDALNKFVKNRTTSEETDRQFNFYSSNSVYRGKYYQYPFVERKIVPFYVYDNTYKAYLINEIVEKEKPVLLVFYYMDNLAGLQTSNINSNSISVQKNEINRKTLQLFNNLELLGNSYVYKN